MIKQVELKPKPTVFTYYDDESTGATEFRRLARNLRNRGNPPEVNSILVTSAAEHEGKSLISANLAIAMAKRENDKKVLLVDCDLRRPVVHSLFGVERVPGFSSILAGKMKPNDVIHDTELDNLKVIASGRVMGSPSQLVPNAKDTLDRCKELFDIIICDTPPVVPVDDVGVLGPHVDGVLLVILAGKTDRMIVKKAIDMLNDVHAKVLGIVLNNLYGVLPYYYDYRYYRYRYRGKETSKDNT